jgi:type I restriction enzyme, S subunit
MESYLERLTVTTGSAFKGTEFCPPGIGRPLLRIRDLKTFVSQTWTTEERSDETTIRPGDIVVGMDAEFRATLWLGEASVLNQRVCSFVPKEGTSRAFVLAALAPELRRAEAGKTGTTVIHLNKADIQQFMVPALSSSQHLTLGLRTEPLLDLVVSRAEESRLLIKIREVLLPALLAGHVRAVDVHEVVR